MLELASLDRRQGETAAAWGLRLIDGLTTLHRQKNRVRVESFVDRLLGLEGEPEVILDLIVAEWTLRRQAGETIELAEYLERFPRWKQEIGLLWEFDQEAPAVFDELGYSVHEPTPFPGWYVGAAPLPVVFGSYRLLQELGGGGMARVFLAEPAAGGSLVVLKVPKLPLEQDSNSITSRATQEQRFLREAHVTQWLDHPGLCRTLDVGRCDGLPYLTMRFYSRGSVAAELHACGTFSQANAARLVADVARAMQHAHDLGMIHRDLKPSNLLRADGGEVVVSDFGLALMFEAVGPRLTGSNEIVGTLRYLSPEQAAGVRTLTPATDIYSLGVILYELLAGQVPFVGDNVALLRAICDASPRPLEELRTDMSPALAAISHTAMGKKPDERYSSMTAFADDLQLFLDRTWYPHLEAEKAPQPPKVDPGLPWDWWRRDRWVAASAAVALFMLGGLTAWAPFQGYIRRLSQSQTEFVSDRPMKRTLMSSRRPIGTPGLLQLLHDDLDQLAAVKRPHTRYFSLVAVYDNPYISDVDFALHFDALRRVLNRLSHSKLDVQVYPVDSSGCLLRIDLRDLDWNSAYEWRDLLNAEPYGVRYDSRVTSDESLRKLAREIYALTASLDAPIVRGDWFTEAATRSPLFDHLQNTHGNDRRTPPFDLTAAGDAVARVVALYRSNTVDARVAAAELGLGTAAELDSRWPPDKIELRTALDRQVSRNHWAEDNDRGLFADYVCALKLGVPRATHSQR
jgi:hypothetical protein